MLSAVLQLQPDSSDLDFEGRCLPSSRLFAAWDGMACFMSSVVSGALSVIETEEAQGVYTTAAVLQSCLEVSAAKQGVSLFLSFYFFIYCLLLFFRKFCFL